MFLPSLDDVISLALAIVVLQSGLRPDDEFASCRNNLE